MKEIVVPQSTIVWCEQALSARGDTLVDITPLRVEASHRCFYRITTVRGSLVLMDSPPTLERNELFMTLGRAFHQQGIPVAEILSMDEGRGLFLLTDLGDIHFEQLYGTPAQDEALTAAIDLLRRFGLINHPAIEPYTAERLHMELDIFSEWFMGKLLRMEIFTGVYDSICHELVSTIDLQPKCCVHRDYHCRNLLYNDNQLGVVDFQDALHGPVLYDIASLLRDCYHVFPEAQIDHWLAYFIGRTSSLEGIPVDTVKLWFDWTAIQRQLKAVGIFARMQLRDGKSTHLRYILPLLERIQNLSRQYPALKQLDMQLESCMDAARPVLA